MVLLVLRVLLTLVLVLVLLLRLSLLVLLVLRLSLLVLVRLSLLVLRLLLLCLSLLCLSMLLLLTELRLPRRLLLLVLLLRGRLMVLRVLLLLRLLRRRLVLLRRLLLLRRRRRRLLLCRRGRRLRVRLPRRRPRNLRRGCRLQVLRVLAVLWRIRRVRAWPHATLTHRRDTRSPHGRWCGRGRPARSPLGGNTVAHCAVSRCWPLSPLRRYAAALGRYAAAPGYRGRCLLAASARAVVVGALLLGVVRNRGAVSIWHGRSSFALGGLLLRLGAPLVRWPLRRVRTGLIIAVGCGVRGRLALRLGLTGCRPRLLLRPTG